MRFFALVIPLIFLSSFIYAAVKKIHVYDVFCDGAKGAIPLLVSLFPYLLSVIVLSKLFQASGLEEKTVEWIAPLFESAGVPKELSRLVLIKPLSGSGATAILTEIVETYGVDSYISRCACILYGSTDTVFYIGAVYFVNAKPKKLTGALIIALFVYLFSVLFGCFICRFL